MVGTSTSDENVFGDDNQTENVQDGLSNSPETMKDNKNIQNNTEKSSVSIVGKKRKLPDEVGMAPKKACVGSVKNVENDHTYYISQSPPRLKRNIDNLLDTVDNLKRRLKQSQQKNRRLKKKGYLLDYSGR